MLDHLKAFLNGELNLPALKKLVDIRQIALKVLNTEGDGNSFIRVDKSTTDKSIHVTLQVQSSDVRDPVLLASRVGELLQDHVQNENKPALEISANETVKELTDTNAYSDQINFFMGKIPDKDLLILRAAYYLRTVHERGQSVAHLKAGITARYGTRGSSIANLCSGGYFETYLRPLYEMLQERPNFTEQMFLDNYEIIIDNAPFAYFVNSGQSEEEIVENIKEKITFGRRYGQHKLAIHAIGRENINKVNAALGDSSIGELINDDIDASVKGNVLTTTIHYRD